MHNKKYNLSLMVNDKTIPLKSFIAKLITNTLLGILSSLKDIETPKEIKITLNEE